MRTTLFAIFCLFLLSACPEKEKDQKVGSVRNTRGATNTNSVVNALGQTQKDANGVIVAPNYETQFNEMAKKFVSSFMDSNELGQISSQVVDTTGVRFRGLVSIPNGFCNNSNFPKTNINLSDSVLQITIYDSYVGQTTTNSEGDDVTISPIPVEFSKAKSGHIQGVNGKLTYEIIFGDEYGEVQFTGEVEGEQTKGVFKFRNFKRFDGGKPDPEQFAAWGDFYIQTDGFLVCK